MIISSSITVGQITFILRGVIQILAYLGLSLISSIILASVSRVAPIGIHDIINRIVGASSVTPSILRWIYDKVRHKHSDPVTSTRFLLLLLLSILYTLFVSLSDIGFLGLRACSVPFPDTTDSPASVTSRDAAVQLITQNVVNSTDLSKIKAYKCNSSNVIDLANGHEIFASACTSWHNSTYADSSFFETNLTDTDAMMPRQLWYTPYHWEPFFYANTFRISFDTHPLTLPTIQQGLAVQPHETGVRLVLGVPKLGINQRVEISSTLAVEVDVGCMALGIRDSSIASGDFFDQYEKNKVIMATNGTWRKYSGPDYMEDILSKIVDDTRAARLFMFDPTTLDSNGDIYSVNSSLVTLSSTASVDRYHYGSDRDYDSIGEDRLIDNCTEALRQKLGINFDPRVRNGGDMCGFFGIGGSSGVDGIKRLLFDRMVCATSTQVNMVNAAVAVDAESRVSVTLTRLPSDLNTVLASYWDTAISKNNKTTNVTFTAYEPYLRYTLNPNPNSPTSHFVHTELGPRRSGTGIGSAGTIISYIGNHLMNLWFWDEYPYLGLTLLEGGSKQLDFHPRELTKWAGEVGGSYFLTSLTYNGWAALQSPPLRIVSTGGRTGTCYTPYYAIAFVPLVVSAVILFAWMLVSMISGSWFGTKVVENGYGGVTPFTAVACPGAPKKSTLLAWEASPEPRLEVVEKDTPLLGDADVTALEYLKSASSSNLG